MSTKVLTKEELVEAVEKMTVLELAELVKLLEEKFGVKAVAAVAPSAVGVGGADSKGSVEEQTEFSAILVAIGDKKIQVIKVIREITNLGLKEAKDLVDNSPKPIKEGIPKAQAEEIKAKLLECGATVEIK